MRRLLLVGLVLVTGAGCATTTRTTTDSRNPAMSLQQTDLAVAGWRVPFECAELSERIERSHSRLYDPVSGSFSTIRTTDERRLRALESRADELGCLVPGSPFTY